MNMESKLEKKIIMLVGTAYYNNYYNNNESVKEMVDYILSVDLHKFFQNLNKLEKELEEDKKEKKKGIKIVDPKPKQEKKPSRFEEKKVNKLIEKLDKMNSPSEYNFFNKK